MRLFRWALLAFTTGASAPLGHLPAEVSKWLAPLLAGSFVALSGVVMEDPVSPKAPVLVSITVSGAFVVQCPLCAVQWLHALVRRRESL